MYTPRTRAIHRTMEPTRAPLCAEALSAGITLRGRHFAAAELLQIRSLVQAAPPSAHRFAISKQVCEALDWRQPNGRLKDRACRAVLARLHEIGFVCLPPPRRPAVSRRLVRFTANTDARPRFSIRARDVEHTSLSAVSTSDAKQNRLWNEYIERYHYLGYGVPLGAQVKYFVHLEQKPVAVLGFSGAAWRVEARERWIGWSEAERQRNLRYVVNNSRFLILPWAQSPNLASRVLSLAARQLRLDWQARYGYRPLLLETFVASERYRGTCYRAANWVEVGHTKGRGRMDRHFKAQGTKKTLLVYPLANDAVRRLRA
jgi:hypothetical protein